jgi:predicted nucleic acid-binding protein
VEWLDRQPADSVWRSGITVFETRFGLALPKGRRRSGLERAFDHVLTEDLVNRVLDFDAMAAATAAQLAADRREAGRAGDLRETLIAGIALARRPRSRPGPPGTSRGSTCRSSTRRTHDEYRSRRGCPFHDARLTLEVPSIPQRGLGAPSTNSITR